MKNWAQTCILENLNFFVFMCKTKTKCSFKKEKLADNNRYQHLDFNLHLNIVI